MKKLILFLLIPVVMVLVVKTSFCGQEDAFKRYSGYIEKNSLKEYNVSKYKIAISTLFPFIIKTGEKKLLVGCFWSGQGAIKKEKKVKLTFEGWQFSDLKGKAEEIISENPLKAKIDTREIAKEKNYPVGFMEEMEITGKTIKAKYEFEINKNTDYGVRIYINFLFNPEVVDKESSPYIDDEKAIYKTKDGSITIAYSNFSPDRFQKTVWRNFRVFIPFPEGFKKGEKKTGKITITLP